jgi:hypothetical protein
MSEDMVRQEFYCDFLSATENILIPFELIQGALTRNTQYMRSGRIAGLDPARFGDDKNGFVIRQGGQVIHADMWGGVDTVHTAGKVVGAYRSKLFDCVAVDVIGLGAGVYDMINNSGVPCIAVNVAETPSNSDRFLKLRDELWWKLREWFEEPVCSVSPVISEVSRNRLVSDIQDIRYKYTPSMRIQIESKDEMKGRLGFSPDVGDALCCTFAPGVEFKLKAVDRAPLGVVTHHASAQGQSDYNPLRFGLGG